MIYGCSQLRELWFIDFNHVEYSDHHLPGFYLGIFVWGGSSGEGTAQDARLLGGPGFSPGENFEFQIARDAI